MNTLRRLSFLTIAIVFCTSAVGAFIPQSASAFTCSNAPVIGFGRQMWHGYFNNRCEQFGGQVRTGGVGGVNTSQSFINLIYNDLHFGNAHQRTSAQFVILTMLGRGPGAPKSVTEGSPNAQLETWMSSVRSYANYGENGSTSWGENGRIDWFVSEHLPCGFLNTFYQNTYDDVAPFLNDRSNSVCGNPFAYEQFILFRDTSGNVIYRIRRLCMNPMGVLGVLQKPQDKYDLSPSISATVGGQPLNGGAEDGQTVRFSYGIRNSGPDPSPVNTNCSIYTNVYNNYTLARGSPTPGGGAGPGGGCPRSFAANFFTPLVSEDVVVSANHTYCRSLFVSPATASVAMRGTEVCVPVVNKPYFKVYGGDLSAGSGQETSPGICTSNTSAAVVGWNKGGGANQYGGAGVQFAAMALGQIYETSTAYGTSAPTPGGLAFANTTASGLSVYGGRLGSLPCMKNYYAAKPASTNSFTSLAAANTSGPYSWNNPGRLNLSGSVPNGKRITLYVGGDLYITNDVTYPASWTQGTAPLLEVIVAGSIYVDHNVSRMDGIYIAQKTATAGSGRIYTCAIGGVAAPADGNLFRTCNRKLTINGVFAAYQVQFLRAPGTLNRAPIGEARGSGNIAEEFDFNPAMWMAQPVGSVTGPATYDSITSLPPVL